MNKIEQHNFKVLEWRIDYLKFENDFLRRENERLKNSYKKLVNSLTIINLDDPEWEQDKIYRRKIVK